MAPRSRECRTEVRPEPTNSNSLGFPWLAIISSRDLLYTPPKPLKIYDMQVAVGLAVLEEDAFLDMDLRGIEMVDFPENGWFSLKSDKAKGVEQLALGPYTLFSAR